MSIYLLCLTNSGPILTKKKGDLESLPFSTVASLNGFHMFFKSLGVTLQATWSEDWTYVWQEFYDSFTLIVCGQLIEEHVLQQIIEYVFGAISLFMHRNDFALPTLGERIKKEAKNYGPIIDAVLEGHTEMMLGVNECISMPDNVEILQRLKEFGTLCGSQFCCATVPAQRLVLGTTEWWNHLHPVDRELLLILLRTSRNVQNDVPVYLSKKSPYVAYRFVTIPISKFVVCVLCGKEPSYRDLHIIAQNVFQSTTFRCIDNKPTAPASWEALDSENILATIFYNYNSLACRRATTHWKRKIPYELLKYFYDQREKLRAQLPNADILEQHCVTQQHKCYSQLGKDASLIYVLFNAALSTHCMRLLTEKITKALLHET